MKLGVKEMKKEYKKVDIGKIEASLLQNMWSYVVGCSAFHLTCFPFYFSCLLSSPLSTFIPLSPCPSPPSPPFLSLPIPPSPSCRTYKMSWRTCWRWQVKCRTYSGVPMVYQKMWMRMT